MLYEPTRPQQASSVRGWQELRVTVAVAKVVQAVAKVVLVVLVCRRPRRRLTAALAAVRDVAYM